MPSKKSSKKSARLSSSPRDKKSKKSSKKVKKDARRRIEDDDPRSNGSGDDFSSGEEAAAAAAAAAAAPAAPAAQGGGSLLRPGSFIMRDAEAAEYEDAEPDVAIAVDHDDLDEVEPLLMFEEQFILTDSDSDSSESSRSDSGGGGGGGATMVGGYRLAKNTQMFVEEEFRSGAFVEIKPSKVAGAADGAATLDDVDGKLASAQALRCEIKLTCAGFKVMSMSIVMGLLAGVELLQFLQFVFLESDVAFLHLTAAPVYLMRFLFFILYTIVCINVSESLIARSRERPDFQNPLQKSGPCTNFFLVICNFGALLLTVANADFENFLFNSVMACDEEICFADGAGDFNSGPDSVNAQQCEVVVATCSSAVLNGVLQDHYYSFQAWKIGRFIRVVMAVMSFVLWSLVKEQQTHDLEEHIHVMAGVIDSKIEAIQEATKKFADLAGLNKVHLSIPELEELQNRQTGLLEQTTELLNLKRQQAID